MFWEVIIVILFVSYVAGVLWKDRIGDENIFELIERRWKDGDEG